MTGKPTREFGYSSLERALLVAAAVLGLTVVNGAFVYGLILEPGALAEAVTNPVAVAFMVEAVLLLGVLAHLLARLRLSRMDWRWFVLLSLLGSIAFALPVALLWRPHDRSEDTG